MRVGHSSACPLTRALRVPPSAWTSQTRPMALSSQPVPPRLKPTASTIQATAAAGRRACEEDIPERTGNVALMKGLLGVSQLGWLGPRGRHLNGGLLPVNVENVRSGPYRGPKPDPYRELDARVRGRFGLTPKDPHAYDGPVSSTCDEQGRRSNCKVSVLLTFASVGRWLER